MRLLLSEMRFILSEKLSVSSVKNEVSPLCKLGCLLGLEGKTLKNIHRMLDGLHAPACLANLQEEHVDVISPISSPPLFSGMNAETAFSCE